eukprot:GFKZ01007221.1.p1 GENE.GFKZ01007221.1~~GFKZ01007221.1.p1  ORF type:complete len:530 (-),score=70.86 GFKZ01007221.1:138-1727(-)
MPRPTLPLLLLLLSLLLHHPTLTTAQLPTTLPSPLVFENRFPALFTRGIPSRSLKFGGPCVADLNNDGRYDVILNFHNRNRTRIFIARPNLPFQLFNNPNTGIPFRTRVLDVHGVGVGPISVNTRDRLVSFSVGGGSGGMPRSAEIYRMQADGGFTDVTNDLGFGQLTSRPRNTVFMDLQLKTNRQRRRDGGGPDMLFTNFLSANGNQTQFAYSNVNGMYELRTMLGDFTRQRRGRVTVTDLEDDGRMEVISILQMRVYRLVAPFTFDDVSSSVLPGIGFPLGTVNAVVEVDFDNDGDYDLYIARPLRAAGVDQFTDDRLLRNDGGVFVDVTRAAGIPEETNSMGVTAGDFNNDGWTDLLVALRREPDMVLLNNGDGTFQRVDNLIPKVEGDIGNNALAVDYDMDGRVDAFVGHGGVRGADLGPYLLMRNVMPLGAGTNFLHVTVFNDPTGAATSMHAVVTVFMPRRRRQVRRIGGRGAQDAEGSYLDTVHFGLGSLETVGLVRVRWTSRIVRRERSVAANSHLEFGIQ